MKFTPEEIIEELEVALEHEHQRYERAINCISAIKLHQQDVARSTYVHSAVMDIINKWEIKELEQQKEIK